MGHAFVVAKSFRELQVWQASMDLTMSIYQLTSGFPKHELYGLSSQMRRAAVSISSNIAEGAGRETRKNFRQFVMIARGSSCELETQRMVAARLGYANEREIQETELLSREVGRMLSGLAKYLNFESRKHPN